MPPLVAAGLAVAGLIIAGRLVRRQMKRVGETLDRAERERGARITTLERDPRTGVYQLNDRERRH